MGTEIDDAPGRGDVEEIAAAARGDVAAHHGPVLRLAVSPDDRHAVVILGSGTDPEYPYQEVCSRIDGAWHGRSGANADGWTSTIDPDDEDAPNLGVSTAWDETAEGCRAAVIRYRDREIAVPAANGLYLFADWDVPDTEIDPIELVRFVD